MNGFIFEFSIILLLLIANGVFAMAEIAMVTSKKARLENLKNTGDPRAQIALDLANSPGNFLSTVQVGITLIGVLAGAFGGASLSARVSELLKDIPYIGTYAQSIGFGLVICLITYLSLVIGELLPKNMALSNPEAISLKVARFMAFISKVASPAVRLLMISTDLLGKLIRVKKSEEVPVSQDEVKVLINQGVMYGVFHRAEKEMVEGVFGLGDKMVRELMTPRSRMVWINLDEADETNWRKIVGSGHSYFPVYQGTRENVLGLISVKAMWANLALANSVKIKDVIQTPLIVPMVMSAIKLIETFKIKKTHIALVSDEFGMIQGLVTLNDVLKAIVGDLPRPDSAKKPSAIPRADGTLLVDGLLDIEEFKKALNIDSLPDEQEGDFYTVGGFVLWKLAHIPQEGESFAWENFKLEVIDMDHHRVDKVLVKKSDAIDGNTNL